MLDRFMLLNYTNGVDANDAKAQAIKCDDVHRVGVEQVGGVWLLLVELAGPNFIDARRQRVARLLGSDLLVEFKMQGVYALRSARTPATP